MNMVTYHASILVFIMFKNSLNDIPNFRAAFGLPPSVLGERISCSCPARHRHADKTEKLWGGDMRDPLVQGKGFVCNPLCRRARSHPKVKWSAGHSGTVHVNPAPYIFVISQPKWLKFGLQPHFFKMFLHTKFQLSITCTFRVTKLLVEVTK